MGDVKKPSSWQGMGLKNQAPVYGDALMRAANSAPNGVIQVPQQSAYAPMSVQHVVPNNDAAPYNPEGEARAIARIMAAPSTLEEVQLAGGSYSPNSRAAIDAAFAAQNKRR